MNWEQFSQIAQIFEGITVLVAVIFGFVQFRQYKQQRRDTAAIELMHSLQDVETIRAMRLVFSLPEGISLEEVRAKGEKYEDAAYAISANLETICLTVHRKNIPAELVEELIGGAIVALWKKLRTWAADYRAEQGHPYFWEWFQWMATRFEEHGRTAQPPAYERNPKIQ